MAISKQEENLVRINRELEKGLRLTEQINKVRPRRVVTKLAATFEEELRLRRLTSNEE